MNDPNDFSHIIETVESRNGSTDTCGPMVKGWQRYLAGMLEKMAPFMPSAKLVTFRQLTEKEKTTFEYIHARLSVPANVSAIFIPPSVLKTMMNDGSPPANQAPDNGILLATRTGDYAVILNALFALPPYYPAVDIYENGCLLSGHVFNSVSECVEGLSDLTRTYLDRRNP